MTRFIAAAFAALALLALTAPASRAAYLEYGDEDLSNTGTYPSDPKAGATLQGLAPDVVTFGAPAVFHSYPFVPAVGDFPGSDQIYVGSVQTGFHDGYSSASPAAGAQILTLDYSSLVAPAQTIATLTLGIGADDFQFPSLGQPYAAKINGVSSLGLTNLLNSIDQGGPVAQFFTIGVDPSLLLPTNILTLSIDNLGDGGDGWSVDFLTVGVTTNVPEPTSLSLTALATAALALATRHRSGGA